MTEAVGLYRQVLALRIYARMALIKRAGIKGNTHDILRNGKLEAFQEIADLLENDPELQRLEGTSAK